MQNRLHILGTTHSIKLYIINNNETELTIGGSQYQYILSEEKINNLLNQFSNKIQSYTYKKRVLITPTMGAGYQGLAHVNKGYKATKNSRQVSIRRLRDFTLFSWL